MAQKCNKRQSSNFPYRLANRLNGDTGYIHSGCTSQGSSSRAHSLPQSQGRQPRSPAPKKRVLSLGLHPRLFQIHNLACRSISKRPRIRVRVTQAPSGVKYRYHPQCLECELQPLTPIISTRSIGLDQLDQFHGNCIKDTHTFLSLFYQLHHGP